MGVSCAPCTFRIYEKQMIVNKSDGGRIALRSKPSETASIQRKLFCRQLLSDGRCRNAIDMVALWIGPWGAFGYSIHIGERHAIEPNSVAVFGTTHALRKGGGCLRWLGSYIIYTIMFYKFGTIYYYVDKSPGRGLE